MCKLHILHGGVHPFYYSVSLGFFTILPSADAERSGPAHVAFSATNKGEKCCVVFVLCLCCIALRLILSSLLK